MQTRQSRGNSSTPERQESPADPAWYPLQTRYQCEKRVHTALREHGFESFSPMRLETRRWRNRTRLVESPLFPGYMFVRMIPDPVSLNSILRLPGMVRFVTAGRDLVAVPNTEMDRVRAVTESDGACEQGPFPAVGEKVRVRGGCLEGIEGIVTGEVGRRELVITVGAIRRSLKIALGSYQIELLD